MKTINFLLLMLVSVVMTSCWTVQSVTVTDIPEKYIGNEYDELVGMSKAEILEVMSIPGRTTDDGLGGEVLLYERMVKKPPYGIEEKEYVHVFVNTDRICYKVDTNIGDLYEPAVTHQECYKVPNRGLLWMLMPPITVWGIIPAIWYAAQNAKVNRGDAKLVPCD